MKKKIIAGNWKMNMLPDEAMNFINSITRCANETQDEIILCVPYTDLFYSLLTAQSTKVRIGAQNVHWEESGAYTGEISAAMLKCINVEYVIIGHSDRKKYFAETDEIINKKIKVSLKNNLKPIVCIGENLEQKEEKITKQVIDTQIEKDLEGISKKQVEDIVIAYEPIWAIGTGKTATTKEISNTIKEIRNKIEDIYGKETSEKITILYGGSVKKENAKDIFKIQNVDGALIGGASLDIEEFKAIIEYNK